MMSSESDEVDDDLLPRHSLSTRIYDWFWDIHQSAWESTKENWDREPPTRDDIEFFFWRVWMTAKYFARESDDD